MTRTQFDNGNARHGVPVSYLQADETHEVTAPTCRGFWSRHYLEDGTPSHVNVFRPLSVADDALCDAHDVPQGVQWATEHDWNAEREMYLHGDRVRLISPDRAAEIIAVTSGVHCHWDAERQTFVTWALRDWERDAARNTTLDNWAERMVEWANTQGVQS